MNFQEACEKYCFEIYEWSKIKGQSTKLPITGLRWIHVDENKVFITAFNKITYLNNGVNALNEVDIEILRGEEWSRNFKIENLDDTTRIS